MPHLPQADLDELYAVISSSGVLDHPWLDALFTALPAQERPKLPVHPAPDTRWKTSVAQLNDAGALADGQLPIAVVLNRLLLESEASIKGVGQRLLMKLQAARGPGGVSLVASLAEVRIVGAALFIDRDSLRRRIIELSRPNGLPAVAINGDARSGKSHTRNLLAHAALSTGLFKVAWVEIKKEQAPSFTADWLVEDLVQSMVRPAQTVPARRDPLPRWLGDLVTWTIDELARPATAVPVWIVIDGLRHPGVGDEVRGVVERLAARAATPTGPLRIRLILIDCDPTDIRRTGCTIEEERIAHLTEDDAKLGLERLDPTGWAQLWPTVEAALRRTTPVTTPSVVEALGEVVR